MRRDVRPNPPAADEVRRTCELLFVVPRRKPLLVQPEQVPGFFDGLLEIFHVATQLLGRVISVSLRRRPCGTRLTQRVCQSAYGYDVAVGQHLVFATREIGSERYQKDLLTLSLSLCFDAATRQRKPS